jgi:hypothetical protein
LNARFERSFSIFFFFFHVYVYFLYSHVFH